MISFKKDEKGGISWKINLIPKFNIALVFQLLALLSSWALHESVIRSLLAFIFGFWYLLAWVIWGDSATGEGVKYIIEYWKHLF